MSGSAPHIKPNSTALPYSRYQVMSNKTIRGLDGKRFIVRGTSAFQRLLWSPTTTSGYRTDYSPAGKGSGTGISEPTYMARLMYRTAAWRATEYDAMQDAGINMIRLAVEYATMKASVSYVDPVDGQTYPSDEVMMDTIVAECSARKIVVQIITGNGYDTETNVLILLRWLKDKYWNSPNVWIAVANEPGGYGLYAANIDNVTLWAAQQRQYVLACREDITGQPAGTKFTNPVCVDPTNWSKRLDAVQATLLSDTAFSADPNLVINIHYYPLNTSTNFATDELPNIKTRWFNYVTQFCIVVNESGHSNEGLNLAYRFDPNLDAGIPSSNLTYWANKQATSKQFFVWADTVSQTTPFSGVSFQSWSGYVARYLGVTYGYHDNNSMRQYDSSGNFIQWATWGNICKGYFLSRQSTNQTYPLT